MKLTTEAERLRRESPAYQPDVEWQELEPQAMNVVISTRFDGRSARRIHQLAREAGQSASALVRDWTLERLESLPTGAEAVTAGVRETPATYEAAPDQYEALRQAYRPELTDILLVGESRPAGGTFFYLANSNLYYATHAAFQLALGPMPSGGDFLTLLRDRGVWLYDLADAPVDRLRGRPRRAAVQARVSDLVTLLRESRPRLIVAIKKDLAVTVRQALHDADLDADRLHVLPFPLYQWRRAYIRGLADVIRPQADAKEPADLGGFGEHGEGWPDARRLLEGLVGKELQTLTGAPNRILRLGGDKVFVATSRSPQGKPVAISEVQGALDELAATGDLLIDVPTVGHRSAFIGAVLRTLPGAAASTGPRRIRLVQNSRRR